MVDRFELGLFTGDFSDMFTSCKHETLRKNLINIIDICFKNSGKNYITVENGKISYTSSTNTKTTYQKEELFELIEHILTNNFVTFSEYTAKQIKGVPMGLPCAPKMIDLTMAYSEYKYLTNPTNREIALKIGNHTCRYVDDFCTFTDIDIQPILSDIYPIELTLNKTSTKNQATFLDTSIRLANNRLQLSVYNKTDDFPFTVIKYGHPDSNVHSSTGYNTFYGEIMRFAKIANHRDSWTDRCKLLVHDFLSLGYEKEKLCITFFKFIRRNNGLAIKHGVITETDAIQLIKLILP